MRKFVRSNRYHNSKHNGQSQIRRLFLPRQRRAWRTRLRADAVAQINVSGTVIDKRTLLQCYLSVSRTTLANPPADASCYTYSLIKVLSDKLVEETEVPEDKEEAQYWLSSSALKRLFPTCRTDLSYRRYKMFTDRWSALHTRYWFRLYYQVSVIQY